jgi:hypothetical protein
MPIFFLIMSLLPAIPTLAADQPGPELSPKPKESVKVCAVVDQVVGQVDVLSGDRTQFWIAKAHEPIACGSWLSVRQGFIQLAHFLGPRVHIAGGSFVRLADIQSDPIVVYRGELLVSINSAHKEEFSVISPSARARLRSGKAIFIFNEKDKITQLIALTETATLENRFESSRKITVRAGELSQFNFMDSRIIPETPQALSIASLKEHLFTLRVSSNDEEHFLELVNQRRNRTVSIALTNRPENALPATRESAAQAELAQEASNREPASEDSDDPSSSLSETSSSKKKPKHAPDPDYFLTRNLPVLTEADKKDLLHPSDTSREKTTLKLNIERLGSKDNPLSESGTSSAALSNSEKQKSQLIEELKQFHPELR